jgi:hypothetical protein
MNYKLTIQDIVNRPVGSESSNRLPEVFGSGAVRTRNERVGPAVVKEATSCY